MTHSPQPTERFAQHPRLAELVTALGFRRYPLFLTGLLYEEPGGPLRRATAVASRDGDLVAYDAGEVVEVAGPCPDLAAVRRRPHRAVSQDPGGRPGRPQSGVLRPRGGQLDQGPPQHQGDRIELLHHWFLRPAVSAAGHHRLRGPRGGPLEATDALLEEVHRLADRHEGGFLIEHVMELLTTS
jgi:hypothetical protein